MRTFTCTFGLQVLNSWAINSVLTGGVKSRLVIRGQGGMTPNDLTGLKNHQSFGSNRIPFNDPQDVNSCRQGGDINLFICVF